MSKSFIVPVLERALADGYVTQYEVDEEAIHTQAPGTFWVFYICPKAQGQSGRASPGRHSMTCALSDAREEAASACIRKLAARRLTDSQRS